MLFKLCTALRVLTVKAVEGFAVRSSVSFVKLTVEIKKITLSQVSVPSEFAIPSVLVATVSIHCDQLSQYIHLYCKSSMQMEA